MSSLWLDILLILLFSAGNGFLAAAEIALVAARRAPIAALAHRGDRRALIVGRLQAHPDLFLATVQLGRSLLSIGAGVVGGVVLVAGLGADLATIPVAFIRGAAPALAFVIVTLIITYLAMVLGELLPRALVLRHPERAALRLVPLVHFLTRAGVGAAKALLWSSKGLAMLTGAGRKKHTALVTEAEIRWLLREGQKRGVFADTEQELIVQIFSFADMQVRRAMTARMDVAAIDRTWERERILSFITVEGYSRYPVYEETLDRVVGIIHTKDVINVLVTGGMIILEDLIRTPMFVPDSQKLGFLLRTMQRRQEHMAIVLDEFGGTAGLITLEDILEEIVGEIRDEHDRELPEFSLDAAGRARIAGKMPIDEFNAHFQVQLEEEVADTVGGYVTFVLGHIPSEGEILETANIRLRVVAMDENRVAWLEGEHLGGTSEPVEQN